ncbi:MULTISPECIES: DUF5681 domain-containing protein [unclassified Ruegeria]|uniref:DUF5681 domain-containing protein n=1 Tax=unclassified Ruegeria TaxID=2625375 RepID=UPI00147C091C|nr:MULTISPECIES: DUF5681 domain-containing protein [unclassified Ruegeria]NOD62042.1 hypothetical protein [Ruegeria sp. HKCCD6109]
MTDQIKAPVGYMRPPEYSRFNKGQSGNPKGRPKKPEDVHVVLQRVLRRKVRPKGADRQMPISEALIRKLRELAISGDRRALDLQRSILDEARATEAKRHDPEKKRKDLVKRIRRKLAEEQAEGAADDRDV